MVDAPLTVPSRSLLEQDLVRRLRDVRSAGVSLDVDAAGSVRDDLLALPADGTVERVMVLHSLVARVQALEIAALADLSPAGPGGPAPRQRVDGSWRVPARADVAPAVVDEVAPALHQGRESTRRRLAEAEQLVRCLPRTHRLLADGLVGLDVARAVVGETARLTEAVAVAVDAAAGEDLVGLTAAAARRLVGRLAMSHDVDAAARRVRAAVAERRVEHRPLVDGTGELRLVGPAPDVRALHEVLTRRARDRSLPGSDVDPYADPTDPSDGTEPARSAGRPRGPAEDRRSMDARRFDVAVAALLAGPPSRDREPSPVVELAVGVSTLLGLDDSPGELSGHGPVPAVVARAWARRGRLRRFFTDPATGAVIGVDGHTYPPGTVPVPTREPPSGPSDGDPPGRDGDDPGGGGPCPSTGSGYRIPVALRRVVTAALPRCVAPGCSVPATRCDLDHRVPWPAGPTCACNLAPLCRTHHRMKTFRGWDVRVGRADGPEPMGGRPGQTHGRPDGTVTWTSPPGAVHEVSPGRRWSVLATDPDAADRAAVRRRARRERTGERDGGGSADGVGLDVAVLLDRVAHGGSSNDPLHGETPGAARRVACWAADLGPPPF